MALASRCLPASRAVRRRLPEAGDPRCSPPARRRGHRAATLLASRCTSQREPHAASAVRFLLLTLAPPVPFPPLASLATGVRQEVRGDMDKVGDGTREVRGDRIRQG
ncbi:unnamed protein product [Urochloa humidicola]